MVGMRKHIYRLNLGYFVSIPNFAQLGMSDLLMPYGRVE